jgi:GT2 family glycosyltransferase/tetratricopeptide (TPR) repeat protein
MTRRYLFGPVSASFADQNLSGLRECKTALAFNAEGTTDLTIQQGDSWAKVTTRFPSGWKPDFIALYLAYASVPECIWSAPIPIIGLALDWPLLWHYYRRRLRSCDLILTDAAGVETLQREGIVNARFANLQGCESSFLAKASAEHADGTPNTNGIARDIDILFVGNLNPAVQRERLAWLTRLARLGKRYRVAIRTGIFGEPYRRLLQRAKIVFSFVSLPRCSRRHFEAPAAGALLVEHVRNQPLLSFFQDRQDCVFYDEDNLEALLEHYLEHADERQQIVRSSRQKIPQFSFEHLWTETVESLDRDWPILFERSRHRAVPSKLEALSVRVWQAFHAPIRSDPMLPHDLDASVASEPNSAALHNLAGLALTRTYQHPKTDVAVAEVAADHFQQAVNLSPSHLLARLNLAEALNIAGDRQSAIEQCQHGLVALERSGDLDSAMLDGGQFVSQFDDFRVLWERAAWSNAGNPRAEALAKQKLLSWRLHLLLSKLTGDLVHQYEAFINSAELPFSAAMLGIALATKNYPTVALSPLRRACTDNPLDRDAARALGHMFSVVGDRQALDELIADRRLLSRAVPQLVPPEPWFSEAKPTGQELASIIILCCNQLDCTKLCLESVLKHTRPPYELVIVDNASTDDTPAFLTELRGRSGPVHVEVIRNETNVGYPAGCNQALVRARGSYLVMLNNDTVVTPGWLETLVQRSLTDWPAVGLVGPVTNYAPEPQGIRAGYQELDGLEEFAARRQKEFQGRSLPVRRLTGFCLLLRREVLDRIGVFDERFGNGFFDDDDLGLRAQEAGFRMLVALDVYVHHFGSKTFQGLGIDTRDQLVKNFEVFRAKWGIDATAGYHLPPAPPAKEAKPAGDGSVPDTSVELPNEAEVESTPTIEPPIVVAETAIVSPAEPPSSEVSITVTENRPKVSLCMIVKNEEARLGACLETAADLFGEVVIADTGSKDRTVEIAKRFGAKIVEFPWCNHFGRARNASLESATGRWIMWLDADDRIDTENRRKLRDLFQSLGDEFAAYALRVRSIMDASGTAFRLLDQVRIFPNHPKVRWEYRVHEQTLPSVNRLGGHVRWTDIVVDHVGYQDVSVRRGKLERNLRLLELDHEEKPDDAFNLFNLGWTLMDLGRSQEALGHLERSLQNSTPESSIMRKLFHLISVARRQLGNKDGARQVCREGLKRFPDDTELLQEIAIIYLESKEFSKAESHLLQLVETTPAPYFGSSDDGVRGFRTRQVLAGNYLEQHRTSEAEVQWRAAIGEQAKFMPAWLALGELYLKQKRWPALHQLTRGLEQNAGGILEAAILRARGHHTRQEFQAARAVLQEVLPLYPDALGPRVLLSHILLQENKDLLAAEHVLREILKLDPPNGEARHNLSVLLKNLGRPVDV